MVAWRLFSLFFLLSAIGVVTTASPAGAGNGCPVVPAKALAGVTVGYPAPPAVVGSAAARLQGVFDPAATQLEWFFEYGPTNAYGSCTAPVAVAAGASAGTGRRDPDRPFRVDDVSLPARGAQRRRDIGRHGRRHDLHDPPGGRDRAGGNGRRRCPEWARRRFGGSGTAAAATAPARLQLSRRQWAVSRSKIGARLDVAAAVAAALQSLPGQALQAAINVDRARLAHYLAFASRRYGLQRPPLVRLIRGRAIVRPARAGVAIKIQAALNLAVHYLEANLSSRLRLPARRTAPSKSTGPSAKAVVVRLEAQT